MAICLALALQRYIHGSLQPCISLVDLDGHLKAFKPRARFENCSVPPALCSRVHCVRLFTITLSATIMYMHHRKPFRGSDTTRPPSRSPRWNSALSASWNGRRRGSARLLGMLHAAGLHGRFPCRFRLRKADPRSAGTILITPVWTRSAWTMQTLVASRSSL
ncbi:hypothetical protein C8R46DRAFT_91248 [Mycena filopes]|nr:hypothetical protein C8R46DRAFT_91248 [Mycena filopes]